MIDGYYYLLSAFAFVMLILSIIFSEIEYYKIDKHGREWDASVFILAPLCMVNMVLCVVLAYESWHIEFINLNVDPVVYEATETLGYLMYFYLFIFFVEVALLSKGIFKFFVESFEETKK